MAKNVLTESRSEDSAPISTTQDSAEAKIGWYNATLDASFWLSRKGLTALEAATLLCQQNPHDDKCDPLLISTDETTPNDFKRLLRVFEDDAKQEAQPRKLTYWLSIAKTEGLKYHSWIDDYLAAIDTVNPALSEQATLGSGKPKAKNGAANNWKEQARAIAIEYISRHKAHDLHPGLEDVAAHVTEIMRKEKIYGPHNKPQSVATVKREALQGDWWRRNG